MKKNKNILYLSYDGMTDPLGQSQVLPYIIGLTKQGYVFTLLSCEKEERFKQNKTTIQAICKANNIDWQPIMYTKRPPVLSTVWDIYKLNKKAKELHRSKEFLLFHCRSYITALIGLGFKQKQGVKFLFDMRGFWADERIDGGIWNKNKFPYKQVYQFFKKKEKAFLSESDAVISLTEEGKKEILLWDNINITPSKISVIPTCVDLELFTHNKVSPESKEQVKKELNLTEENFILTYLGSLGTWYLLQEMLDFFAVLLMQKPQAIFVIYTADNPQLVLDLIDKMALNKSQIRIKQLARNEVPRYLSITDLSISFIKPLYSKKASSPTKMGEIFGMGIPMDCNNNVGDVEQIIVENSCGIIVEDFNKAAYLKAIESIADLKNKDKNHYLEASKKVFSLAKGVKDFNSIYSQLLK